MNAVSILEAREGQRSDISLFYKRCGYPHAIAPADVVFAARKEGAVVGTVRLSVERGMLVLRGMQVLSEYQRQGIGKRLLEACLQRIGDSECYCLPWRHLEKFYGSEGFSRVEVETVPDFLAERYQTYIDDGYDVILMLRPRG